MSKSGMSIHSKMAFDESAAVRYLSSVLESSGRIKTFFSENDRTPNQDGFFELIGKKMIPEKQFVVQIKKVEGLTPKTKGKNKGRYVYSLKTNFLYYIKEKVTENPAIYFIVDIISKKIFWLYLSDELLMELNFEGHQKIQYAFSESQILNDINEFIHQISSISNVRNTLSLKGTPEEISEMQESLDYINGLLNYDLHGHALSPSQNRSIIT